MQADPSTTDAERIKAQQELAEIEARTAQFRIEAEAEVAAVEAERVAGARDLARQVLDSQTELAELEGRRHDVFSANLDAEIQQIRELGSRAGQTADEIEAHVARLTTARTAQFNVDDVKIGRAHV